MPSLPPKLWAELFYDGAWNTITDDVRQTSPVTVTRGLSSESSSEAEPTSGELTLDSRDHKYAPRNLRSPLWNKIGRNTPLRWGYNMGSPYAQISGVAGSRVTTPDSAALAVTDLDIRIDLALEDWTDPQSELVARYNTTGNNRSWALVMAGTAQVTLYWSPDGSLASRIQEFSTIPVEAYNGQRLALRATLDVDNGSGGYEVRFYTGRTVDDPEDNWSLLGDPVVGSSTTAVFDGTGSIEIGDSAGFADNVPNGKFYAFQQLGSIGGTSVCSMNTKDASPGARSFTSGGVAWTVSGGAILTDKHTRLSAEVPAWPPTRDLSGNDTVVNLEPSGLMRRMDAGSKTADSALLSFIRSNSPVECWPLTDGPQSETFKSLVGGNDMDQTVQVGTDTDVVKAAGSLADWIEPVISAKANTTAYLSVATRRTTGTDATWSFDLFLSGGGPLSTGTFTFRDRGAWTDADNMVSIDVIMTGSLDRLSVIRNSYGSSSSSSALLANIDGVGIYDDDPHHIRLSIDPGATNTTWNLYVDGVSVGSGTISSIVVKSLGSVFLGWGFASGDGMTDRSFGYFTYWDGTGPTAAQMYDALMGSPGERAGARIERLATSSGYPATVAGESVYQRKMGIQDRKALLELLNDANKTDFGYLLEARDRNELIHRGQSTLWNQPPGLILDFSNGVISAPFRPVDDDKLTENDVSVKREFGSLTARQTLEAGRLSVQDFPNGVGRYDKSYTYSLYTDGQADDVAYLRLHLGTYDGVRYTRITLNLANERVYQMIDEILRLDVGDKIRLVNVPEDHGLDDVEVLVQGYSEEAGPDSWKITLNCVPGEPWTTGVVGSEAYGRVDTGGTEITNAIPNNLTVFSVTANDGYGWIRTIDHASEIPFDIRVGGVTGEIMRVLIVANTTINSVLSTFQLGTTNWTATNSTIAAENSISQDGMKHSLKITSTAGSTPRVQSPLAAATAGSSYDAFGWLYAPSSIPVDVGINVNWYDASQVYLSTSDNTAAITPGEWTHYATTFTAPVGAAFGAVVITMAGTPGAGYVMYADNVAIATPDLTPTTSSFIVARGINGYAVAHADASDVRLAYPSYVAP